MTAFLPIPQPSVPPIVKPGPARPPARWVRAGKVRPGILLWALGVPIPLILLFFLIRGCV